MPISRERAIRHVEEYCAHLKRFPQNANWPRFIYHTAHVSAAVCILTNGTIIPRGMQRLITHDVANQGAVHNNPESHRYSRFYFRPKNRFHLKTEGIKCIGHPHRDTYHMSIPVTFAFDFISTLSNPRIGFSARNMAHANARPEFTEDFFDSIPFEDVYHDAALPADRRDEILDRRMAEVAFPGEFPIHPNLKQIICRSRFDVLTLERLLEISGVALPKHLYVEKIPQSIFFHWEMYISDIYHDGEALNVKLHLANKNPDSGRLHIGIRHYRSDTVLFEGRYEFDASSNWLKINRVQNLANSFVRIELEDVLAYDGAIPTSGSDLF